MTPSNNFNVLPVYGSIDEQNARRWWVYGKVYPLYTPLGVLPTFQFVRPHVGEVLGSIGTYDGYYIHSGFPTPEDDGGFNTVEEFEVQEGENFCYRRLPNIDNQPAGALKLMYVNDSMQILLELGPDADPDGEFYCSENGLVYIQQIDGQDEAFAFYDSAEPDDVFVKLRDLSGREVETKGEVLTIQRDGDKDYIICNAAAFEFEGMQPGCYYLSLIDYGNNYYSDVFVWKENVADLLMLEWWDNQDFEMDAGRIVYNLPGGGTYKNRLYLPSDIAKPEYTFDEEGETRDGYFFPTKMISEKRYRFSFWAPEYLLDALRFVRMADNIRITHKGQEFAPDTFLITPEWQAEGDLAAVDAEFETDTVAKKINFVK